MVAHQTGDTHIHTYLHTLSTILTHIPTTCPPPPPPTTHTHTPTQNTEEGKYCMGGYCPGVQKGRHIFCLGQNACGYCSRGKTG